MAAKDHRRKESKMKLIEKTSTTEIWKNDKGDMVGIIESSGLGERTLKRFFHVVVREAGQATGKTVNTRCTYETAMQIVNLYRR